MCGRSIADNLCRGEGTQSVAYFILCQATECFIDWLIESLIDWFSEQLVYQSVSELVDLLIGNGLFH